MYQNRVDPFGNIIRTPERGLWLGNRGVIHNDKQEIIRSYKLKAWITCVLTFKNRHRKIMQPARWTELFFVDEATAFSAGHRPCFQCRFKDHQRFKALWIAGNPKYGFTRQTPVPCIDAILHSERITARNTKIQWEGNLSNLPDGTFINYDDIPYLVREKKIYEWTAGGYKAYINLPIKHTVQVLTPRSIVNMFRAGYVPQIKISPK